METFVAGLVIRPLANGEFGALRDVLVDALADDPGWTVVLPDSEHRRTALRSLVGVALADSGDQARVALTERRVVGGAVWQLPGRYPMSMWRQVRAVPRMLPMLVRLGPRARAVQRFGEAIDEVFPATPVRYLQILGVAPTHQGRAVGSRLLADGLVAADAEGDDVYLETGKAANVGYYQRHGFTLVAPAGPLYDGGPTMWRMCRSSAR